MKVKIGQQSSSKSAGHSCSNVGTKPSNWAEEDTSNEYSKDGLSDFDLIVEEDRESVGGEGTST